MPGPDSVNKYAQRRLDELDAEEARRPMAPHPMPTPPPPASADTVAKAGVLESLVREMGRHIASRLGGDAPPPDAPPPTHPGASFYTEKPKNELSERLLRRKNAP